MYSNFRASYLQLHFKLGLFVDSFFIKFADAFRHRKYFVHNGAHLLMQMNIHNIHFNSLFNIYEHTQNCDSKL